MGRIRQFFGLEKRSGFDELEAFLAAARSTAAGIGVDPETALRYPPVLAAVRLISESVAQLPVHLFQKDGEGRQRADDHPVEAIIARRPNPWSTPWQVKSDLTSQLLTRGEAFGLVARAADGRVLELIPLRRGAVCVTTADDMSPIYTLTMPSGAQRVLDRSEIFHLRGMSHGCGRPLSPVVEGADAIGLGLALEQHAANLMKRGARPAGVVSTPSKLSDPAIARMRASIEAAHAGAASGRTLVLEEGSTFTPLTFASTDLEFAAMRSFQVAEVSRLFRVPLSLLSEMDRVTHANAESLGQQFLTLTLLPILRLWCETIARDLLNEDEQASYYAEFLTAGLEMADLANRVDAYVKSIAGGLMTADECRARENLPPEGGEAAKLRFPLNTAADGAAPATDPGAANG
ncbi:HK97 family phage portal protein [Nitrospirillum amazonense]|uniref:HK97 family phage portal protein n=1 Tax=Nitrospirillum amazonense TaxID=28077 RepID=A0A560FKL4_9PROT|nr:phage portal protein [Nitrospirillum amazonense]TWB22144.1 HK97 family phage portal protein [Nitrospirillum amazonense]